MKKGAKERKKVYRKLFCLIVSLFDLCSAFAWLLLYDPRSIQNTQRNHQSAQATIDTIFALVYEELFFHFILEIAELFSPTIAAIIKSWELLK